MDGPDSCSLYTIFERNQYAEHEQLSITEESMGFKDLMLDRFILGLQQIDASE